RRGRGGGVAAPDLRCHTAFPGRGAARSDASQNGPMAAAAAARSRLCAAAFHAAARPGNTKLLSSRPRRAGSVVVHLQGGDEGFLGDLDPAELAHLLLAGLLLVEQLALAGDVAAIAFG